MSFRKRRQRRSACLMPTAPLRHIDPPSPFSDVVLDECIRIVHARRASKLRKRGVVLDNLGDGGFVWFEHPDSMLGRRMQKGLSKAMRRSGVIGYSNAGFSLVTSAALEHQRVPLPFATLDSDFVVNPGRR
jgi:hypothetical protein